MLRSRMISTEVLVALDRRSSFHFTGLWNQPSKRNELSGRVVMARTTSASLHFRAPSGGLSEEASQVDEAFGGDGFWSWRVVEDFDRDPAVVGCFPECFDDGCIFYLAHAGAAEVGVIGVEVDGPVLALADDLADGLVFVAHGLHVEVELAGGMADGFAQPDGFGGAGEEIRFDMSERLHGDGDAEWSAVFGGGAEHFRGAGEGVIVVPIRVE